MRRIAQCVARTYQSPYDRFLVQLNNSGSFGTTIPGVDWACWGNLDTNKTGDSGWNTTASQSSGDYYVTLMDINGDGLPDRVLKQYTSPFTNFIVQFNNGAGFEVPEYRGPINTQGNNGNSNKVAPIGLMVPWSGRLWWILTVTDCRTA